MNADFDQRMQDAAKRRWERATEAQSDQGGIHGRRPEYTSRSTERTIPGEDDLVEPDVLDYEASVHRLVNLDHDQFARPKEASTASPDPEHLDAIRNMLLSGGLRQAILLREILDPPSHRW